MILMSFFYNGGLKSVRSFELGNDLLWFFLDPQQVENATMTIVEGTDLRLDFGEIGILTFLDVLGNQDLEWSANAIV